MSENKRLNVLKIMFNIFFPKIAVSFIRQFVKVIGKLKLYRIESIKELRKFNLAKLKIWAKENGVLKGQILKSRIFKARGILHT